jgi:hypothetical protein
MNLVQDPGIIEKVLEVQHIKRKSKKDFLLPKDMRMSEIRDWADRVVTRAKQKRIERTDGRTNKENWSMPSFSYGTVAQQSGNSFYPLATRICEIISNFGRLTIDEIPQEFGALEKALVVTVANRMRADGYLRDYIETSKEEKGLLTLELVEQKELEVEPEREPAELGVLTDAESTEREDDKHDDVAKKIPNERGNHPRKSSPKESVD